MQNKEFDFNNINLSEIRQIAIQNYVEGSVRSKDLQLESIIKAFITYCKRNNLTVTNGKVYKSRYE